MMGQNPQNQCFVVGFDGNCPEKPHHRSSSCPASGDCNNGQSNGGPNPMVSSEIIFVIFLSPKFFVGSFCMHILRFYMAHLSVVQIKTINIQMIEVITLQMKLLVITMLVGKEPWPLSFNKICNFTNKIQSFYSKNID